MRISDWSSDVCSSDLPDSSTAPLFFPSCEPNYTSDQKMTNYAFFGNIEYDVVEAITLKAGTRYTKSKRDAVLCTRDIAATPDVGAFFHNILLGGALGPYVRGDRKSTRLNSSH